MKAAWGILSCGFLALSGGGVQADDVVNGQRQRISGSVRFTFWEDGDPHGYRVKGLGRRLQQGEKALVLTEEAERLSLKDPVIEAPAGFMVHTDDLSIRKQDLVEEIYPQKKTTWSGYVIAGTWIVTVPQETTPGAYTVQIRFPAIDARLKEVRDQWQRQMKAQDAEYHPKKVDPLLLRLHLTTYRTQADMLLTAHVKPKLEEAGESLCILQLFCTLAGLSLLLLFLKPQWWAILSFALTGWVSYGFAIRYFKTFHEALAILWEIDAAQAMATAAAVSFGIFLLGFLFFLRIEKSPFRSAVAAGYACWWLLLASVTVVSWLLPAELPSGLRFLSDFRAGFPFALPVALLGVACPYLLHVGHFRRVVRKIKEIKQELSQQGGSRD